MDCSNDCDPDRVCPGCRGALCRPVSNPCVRCGAPAGPYASSTRHGGCGHCRQRKFSFEWLFRLGVYAGPLRQACLTAKRTPLWATALSQLLYEVEGPRLAAHQWSWIVPVPEAWPRRFQRPHNPAATIAAELSRRLQVPLATHILASARAVRSQKRLSPVARHRNLRGAFRLTRHAGLVKGQRVLVVDDVLTTGATSSEAARCLRRAGAKSVSVAVVARVLSHPVGDSVRNVRRSEDSG